MEFTQVPDLSVELRGSGAGARSPGSGVGGLREVLASSQGLYPGLRQGRILGWALRTNPRPIEVEGPHVGALRGIEASLREEREGLVPEAGAPFRGRARSHGATHRGRRR